MINVAVVATIDTNAVKNGSSVAIPRALGSFSGTMITAPASGLPPRRVSPLGCCTKAFPLSP